MNKPYSCYILLMLIGSFVFSGCTEEKPNDKENELDFDQQAMLTNIGQNIIFPHYASFKDKTAALQTAISAFTANPNEAQIEAARTALKDAYFSWQRVTIYEFGPAGDWALRQNVNEFPADFPTIENKIANGSWDLNSFTSIKLKGLPALDYLLFKENALSDFTEGENAANRSQYLQDVADQLALLAEDIYQEWDPQQGNYLGEFNTNLGNSAGSSLSLLVNSLNEGFERIKNKKLSFPLGNRSIDEEPSPLWVEAYYSGISLELMKANLESVENTFRGRANGLEGLGLDDNLDTHYQAGNIQDDLTDIILSELQDARQAIEAIPAPLSDAVVNARDKANMAYDELQALVVHLKTDMPQALSVLISYVDNDGD